MCVTADSWLSRPTWWHVNVLAANLRWLSRIGRRLIVLSRTDYVVVQLPYGGIIVLYRQLMYWVSLQSWPVVLVVLQATWYMGNIVIVACCIVGAV